MYINATSSQALTDHSRDSPSPTPESLEIRHEFTSHSLVPRKGGGGSKGGGSKGGGSKGGGSKWKGGSSKPSVSSNSNTKINDYKCAKKVKETFSNDAIYTVISKEHTLCNRWARDVMAVCPDLENLSVGENIESAITPADHRLSSVSGLFGPNGMLSSLGDTNSTIADCVTNEFNRIADELKQDPAHDTGRNLGMIIGGSVAGLVLIGVILFCRKRCSAWLSSLPNVRGVRAMEVSAQDHRNINQHNNIGLTVNRLSRDLNDEAV